MYQNYEYSLGITSESDIEKFLLDKEMGDSVPVVLSDGRESQLIIVEKILDNYESVWLSKNGYDGEFVLFIVEIDGALFAGRREYEWEPEAEDALWLDFTAILDYSINSDEKKITCKPYESLRGLTCGDVGTDKPVSRFGGWPVGSDGKQLVDEWPHFNDIPLIFNAQYKLPDGRMAWVFVGGVEEVQTVKYIPHNPIWEDYSVYDESIPPGVMLEEHHGKYGTDMWHYHNRHFIGQKRPFKLAKKTWNPENSANCVLIEGSPIPDWITARKPNADLTPFLSVSSQRAAAFPENVPHIPFWIQEEDDIQYSYKFLFQIDDEAGKIVFPYGDWGSAYIFWDGKDSARIVLQCY